MNIDKQTNNVRHTYGYVVAPKLDIKAFKEDIDIEVGEMGEEMLLGGVRAVPSKLQQSGFDFEHPTIKDALESAVKETI